MIHKCYYHTCPYSEGSHCPLWVLFWMLLYHADFIQAQLFSLGAFVVLLVRFVYIFGRVLILTGFFGFLLQFDHGNASFLLMRTPYSVSDSGKHRLYDTIFTNSAIIQDSCLILIWRALSWVPKPFDIILLCLVVESIVHNWESFWNIYSVLEELFEFVFYRIVWERKVRLQSLVQRVGTNCWPNVFNSQFSLFPMTYLTPCYDRREWQLANNPKIQDLALPLFTFILSFFFNSSSNALSFTAFLDSLVFESR